MLKKFVSSLLLLALVGCGAQGSAQPVDTAALAENAVKQLAVEEKVTLIEDRIVQGLFFFEEDVVKQSTVYMHNDSSADVVAVFEVEDVDSCRASIKDFLETTKAQMQAYFPDEVFKVDNAVVEDNGRVVVLIICDNLEEAKKVASDMLE